MEIYVKARVNDENEEKRKIQVSIFCKGLKGDAENWCNNRLSSDVYDSIVDI